MSDGASVWVAVKTQRRVVRIDARTGRVMKRWDPGGEPSRVAAGLGSVWVAARIGPPWQGQVIRYGADGSELGRFTLPRPASAVAAGAGFVWVTLEEDVRLLRIDPRTGDFVVWARLSAPGTALSYGDGYLWASLNSIETVARVSPRRTGSVPTAVGHRPAQSVAAGGRVFVAVTTDHILRLLNPRSARVAGAPVGVPLNPYALTADDQAVWVTGLGNNTVTRIAYR
jgi:DNA-binding beta-propeller fold protein YncE